VRDLDDVTMRTQWYDLTFDGAVRGRLPYTIGRHGSNKKSEAYDLRHHGLFVVVESEVRVVADFNKITELGTSGASSEVGVREPTRPRPTAALGGAGREGGGSAPPLALEAWDYQGEAGALSIACPPGN
jgi:hypothetical protein